MDRITTSHVYFKEKAQFLKVPGSWYRGPGDNFGGPCGPPLLTPPDPAVTAVKRHGVVQPHCKKVHTLSSTFPVLNDRPKNLLALGRMSPSQHSHHSPTLIEVSWAKPSLPGAKDGVSLPKVDLFPKKRGEGSRSLWHIPLHSFPLWHMPLARAGSALKCRAGDAVTPCDFPRRKSQIKEE